MVNTLASFYLLVGWNPENTGGANQTPKALLLRIENSDDRHAQTNACAATVKV
jgi:hypothetical protein